MNGREIIYYPPICAKEADSLFVIKNMTSDVIGNLRVPIYVVVSFKRFIDLCCLFIVIVFRVSLIGIIVRVRWRWCSLKSWVRTKKS